MSARCAIGLLALALLAPSAVGAPRDAVIAEAIVAADVLPPDPADGRWQRVTLPDAHEAPQVWYRITFDRPEAASDEFWMLYLPYLYGGGRVWLNGTLIASVLESNESLRVRWERPLLLPLPTSTLRLGPNVLLFRVVAAHQPSGAGLPRLVVGQQQVLQPLFDRRLFWVRTVPVITVATGIVVGTFMLFIWLRRRDEILYGLFGLAALLWALRTTTFVYDAIAVEWWTLWRLTYHASTGGFIIVLALFTLELAGWRSRRLASALLAYWALGPIVFLLAGSNGDALVSRWWVGGLIPVGVGMVAVSFGAAVRQRTATTIALAAALTLAVLCGVHDYLIAWRSSWLVALLPDWSGSRIYLLHHGANVLLVVMGGLLTARFTRNLLELERMNRTLEIRVADREREIAASYEKIATLSREQAATEERERIMEDLHDGLGSQLFTSLLRVERGALDNAGIADVLRSCIGDMRLAIEASTAAEHDFRTALGNVLFRWEQQMREAGITPSWQIDADDAAVRLSAAASLQSLRILQEALTNVLKHAHARSVHVRFSPDARGARLEIEDDGDGFDPHAASAGRGLANMRLRADRVGARIEVSSSPGTTRVTLLLPQAATPA